MTTEYKSVVRRESNVENTLRGGLKNGQWGLFANTSNNYVDGGINRNSGSIWALDQNSRFHEFLDRKTITTLISSAISAIPAPATSTPGGALTSIQYNNGGALGGFGTFDGANVNIGANNLITFGDIGTSTYADFVNKIYTRTIRLSNNETNSTESLLQIVNGDNTSTRDTAYISENRASGLALNIYSSNQLNTGASLQVSSNAGNAITALSTSGKGIITSTDSGDYTIFAYGGTSASIFAQNGIETKNINSGDNDLTLKRNNVLKATIATALTTIHQALDVQGVGTFDSIVTDVGGIASATNYKLTNLTYNELVKYMYEARPAIVGTGSEDTTIFTSVGTGTNQVNFKLIRNNGGYFDRNLYVEQNQTIGGNQYITGTSRVNGVTNYGSRTTEPTGTLVAGDKYHLSTGSIGWYTYSGSAWVKDRVTSDFLDLDVTAPVNHVITAINTDEPFLFWKALVSDSAKNFTFDSATGVYTYIGPSGVKFDGRLSFSGTGSTTNMVCELSIYVDTGSGFTRLTNSIYPVTYDSSAPRLGTQMTTAILNNGYKIKVMLRCTKTGTITYGYIKKQVRQA